MRIVVVPDADAVARSTASRMLVAVQDSLTVQSAAHISLTGGGVGTATVAALASSPLAEDIDWTSVHVWWSDERFLPPGDSERNEHQAHLHGLHHLPLPEENIHRIGDAVAYGEVEAAAEAYAHEITSVQDSSVGCDVTVLGIGPDGHVASLFPEHPGLDATGITVAIKDSPKPPAARVSMTLDVINRSRKVWCIAAGKQKATAVRDAYQQNQAMPVGRVRGVDETLLIVDAAAASLL